MKTKIFCDIADYNLINRFNQKKIVKGFTTNPSLMRKAGAKDYSVYSKKILKRTNKPVSLEVFADDIDKMIEQGDKISRWGKNVYVKVPVTNSKGKFMGVVIKKLNRDKIKLNITAVYKADQTKKILKQINKDSNCFFGSSRLSFMKSSLKKPAININQISPLYLLRRNHLAIDLLIHHFLK